MAVGKPDFDLNSYGIQYKEKKVNYTNKKRLTVTTDAEEAREHAKWEKMHKPLEVQSNNSKKRGEPAPKPNAAQAVGTAPTKTQPFTEIKDGKQQDKKDQNESDKFSRITQPATSSPPTEGHEDTSPTVDKIPHAARTRAGGIVDLHGGKGRKQSQGEGLSTLSTQEGGSSHVQMKPSVPKRGGGGGDKDQIADIMQRESRKNPTNPKGYTPPTKKETKDIDSGKDPKGLRGQKGTEYTSQRLASIKSTAEETVFKAISLKLDLMKTTGKNTGDTPSYIKEVTNQETGEIEQKKEFENKPTFTDLKGDNPHTNPLHVQGKGFKGRQMRRKNPETGEVEKVPKETTTTKIGNVPTKHKKGDIVPHNSPSLQETPENLKRRMDYLMHGEKIGGDLTNTKTQKELDEEHNNREADAFAQTDAGKRIAAKIAQQNAKKEKLKKSLNDIIIKMDIMKLDLMKKDDPCWKGYEQYGMKDKDGKQVPNCVKKAEEEKKPLNKPMRDGGNKKFKVYVRDPSTGNIITVRFGDPNMEIKRDSPERRASFRARHKCSEQKDITSAAYWSCKMWEKTSSVSDNIGKAADETIFKAISLKLDIMKETEVERIKKIPANTDEEIQQKRFALSDAMRSDNMAKPDKSLLLD